VDPNAFAFSQLPSGNSLDAEAGDIVILSDATMGNNVLEPQAQVVGSGQIDSADSLTAMVNLVEDFAPNLGFFS
jgi:hypothetical protein